MAFMNVAISPACSTSFQAILASLPLLSLLCYFLYLAHERPNERCYVAAHKRGEVEDACELVPLRHMLIVFVMIGLLWNAIAFYLSVYEVRRRALVEQYMGSGTFLRGNIYFKEDHQRYDPMSCNRTAYGYVVYAHPNYGKLPVFIRRQVRVFERFSVEGASITLLDERPFSAQSREALEMEMELFRQNHGRMVALRVISIFWILFCTLSPIYILKVLFDLEQAGLYDFQPDDDKFFDPRNLSIIFAFFSGLFNPLISYLMTLWAWQRYEYWMTWQHKIVEDDDIENEDFYHSLESVVPNMVCIDTTMVCAGPEPMRKPKSKRTCVT